MEIVYIYLALHGLALLWNIGYTAIKKKKFIDLKFTLGNIIKGETVKYQAYLGRIVPTKAVKVADNHYYSPSRAIINKAIPLIQKKMTDLGYIGGAYIPDRRDCDEYAGRMWVEAKDILIELTKEIPEAQKKGINCGMFSFLNDTGTPHRLVGIIDADDEIVFLENWETRKCIPGTIVRKLTPTEIASGRWII